MKYLRVSEVNEVPISSNIWVASTTIKNREKLKYIFVTILGLAESFKTMNQPGLTVTLFDGLFFGNYDR